MFYDHNLTTYSFLSTIHIRFLCLLPIYCFIDVLFNISRIQDWVVQRKLVICKKVGCCLRTKKLYEVHVPPPKAWEYQQSTRLTLIFYN